MTIAGTGARVKTLLLALAALAFTAPAASAACPAQPLSKPFTPWLDYADYQAAPDGGLEAGGAGWTLAGGAAVVDGNDPFLAGSRSLALPDGASAATAPVCLTIAHPTLRFFARGTGRLTVTVAFRTLLGLTVELPVGVLSGSGAWAPSPILPVLANLVSDQARFRFTAAGDWRVDDVFVDPYSKG